MLHWLYWLYWLYWLFLCHNRLEDKNVRFSPGVGPGSAAPPTRITVCIDGFNLHVGMREQGWRQYYWLGNRTVGLRYAKAGPD